MSKRIVVLGAGESGAGAAVLAKVKGFDVFVSDMSGIKDVYKKQLDDYGIEWEEGRHTAEKILNADEVVKSPGIPESAPMIQALKKQGTPVVSEIEFAGRYTDARMIWHYRQQREDYHDASFVSYIEKSRPQRRSGRECGKEPRLAGSDRTL